MLTVVECVICNKEAFVRDTYQSGQYTCLLLSCGCENVLCPRCDKPSANVLYSEGECSLICDHCDDGSEMFDPPGFQSHQPSRQVSKRWREQNRAYSLDDIRKVHPRAYLKWTEDERTTLEALRSRGKTPDDIHAIFQRQPHISSSPPKVLGRFIPDTAAVNLLGEKITCGSCKHETILTYLHLERVAKRLTVNVLDISKEMLLDAMKLAFKCTQCKSKAVTVEA